MKHFYFALISLFFLSCKDDNNCCLNSFKGNLVKIPSTFYEKLKEGFDYRDGKGNLVKKGICMNYVIQVNDPSFP